MRAVYGGRANGKSIRLLSELMSIGGLLLPHIEEQAEEKITADDFGFDLDHLEVSFDPEPVRVLYSGNRTIVFWKDGTKTIVKCSEEEEFDGYTGFVAALAKKIYGKTALVKQMLSERSDYR